MGTLRKLAFGITMVSLLAAYLGCATPQRRANYFNRQLSKAAALVQEGDLESALKEYDKVIEKGIDLDKGPTYNEYASACYEGGVIHMEQGRDNHAIAYLSEAERIYQIRLADEKTPLGERPSLREGLKKTVAMLLELYKRIGDNENVELYSRYLEIVNELTGKNKD